MLFGSPSRLGTEIPLDRPRPPWSAPSAADRVCPGTPAKSTSARSRSATGRRRRRSSSAARPSPQPTSRSPPDTRKSGIGHAPVVSRARQVQRGMEPFARADLEFRHSLIDSGPASIESGFDEATESPGHHRGLARRRAAGHLRHRHRLHGTRGLAACRELTAVLVIGPCQTAMHLAAVRGHTFSFITVLDRGRSLALPSAAGRAKSLQGWRDSSSARRDARRSWQPASPPKLRGLSRALFGQSVASPRGT